MPALCECLTSWFYYEWLQSQSRWPLDYCGHNLQTSRQGTGNKDRAKAPAAPPPSSSTWKPEELVLEQPVLRLLLMLRGVHPITAAPRDGSCVGRWARRESEAPRCGWKYFLNLYPVINCCGCQRLSALRQSHVRKKADVGKFVSTIVCISRDIYFVVQIYGSAALSRSTQGWCLCLKILPRVLFWISQRASELTVLAQAASSGPAPVPTAPVPPKLWGNHSLSDIGQLSAVTDRTAPGRYFACNQDCCWDAYQYLTSDFKKKKKGERKLFSSFNTKKIVEGAGSLNDPRPCRMWTTVSHGRSKVKR